VQRDEFVRTIAGEMPDLFVEIQEEADASAFMERLRERTDTRKVF
jgi:hypothetical protein